MLNVQLCLMMILIYGNVVIDSVRDVNEDLAKGLVTNDLLLIKQPEFCPFACTPILSNYPEDCAALYLSGLTKTGIYEIWPREGKPFKVLCDMTTDGGGWTVFQRRDDYKNQVDFYRTWLEYKRGFGILGEQFWLGNDRISMLTNQDSYQLRVDVGDFDGKNAYAQYYSFLIANEADKYRLKLGTFSKGDAGDSFSWHNNQQFSTKDQDNDQHPHSCAQIYNGAWWYRSCHVSNLNGGYLRGSHPAIYATSVNWEAWRSSYYSLKSTEMKIRPIWFKP